MKNNSDEINFKKKNANSINLEQSKKNNIITEIDLKTNFSNPTYIKQISNFSKIRIILIALYFIFVIGLEFFYRDYLFKKSIILQENIQRNHEYVSILKLSKIISYLGGEVSAVVIMSLIFLFMPLNYSFLLLQSIIYSAYFTNIMKMIYQSDRPNWRSKYLTYYCNYEYGNPSGHSFNSINMFLCLAHVLVKYFKIKKFSFLHIFIFVLSIFISFLIMLSRFILAAHSINQIIYGAFLGLGIYAVLIHIIKYHEYSSIQFYQHIKKKRVKKFYYIFHICLLIISIFIYLLTENKEHTDINETVFNGIRCEIKPEYKRYKNGGFFQSLAIMAIIGAQFGFDILFILLKSNNYIINYSIVEWNKNNSIKLVLLRMIIISISSICVILYFVVPGDIILILVFLFKAALPFFLGMAGIYSFGIYLCIKVKIANKDIYKMDALHEITAEV